MKKFQKNLAKSVLLMYNGYERTALKKLSQDVCAVSRNASDLRGYTA